MVMHWIYRLLQSMHSSNNYLQRYRGSSVSLSIYSSGAQPFSSGNRNILRSLRNAMRLDILILGQKAVSGFDENYSEAYETSHSLDTIAPVNEHKRRTVLKDRNMIGAIIGDIVGSIYEPKDRRIKTKDFPFFSENCRFT